MLVRRWCGVLLGAGPYQTVQMVHPFDIHEEASAILVGAQDERRREAAARAFLGGYDAGAVC